MTTALLLIDVQNSMFNGESAVYQSDVMLKRILALEKYALEKQLPIFYLQHSGDVGSPEEKNTETWKLNPSLLLKGPVVEKTELNAFALTEIDQLLQKNNVNSLIIAGMQSDYCIFANSMAASQLGYDITLVSDAHSTCDSSTENAATIISGINEKLGSVVQLKTTEDILKS